MRMKTVDCVEMKHRGAEKVREQIKDMTVEQELAFWQDRSHILKRRQEIAKEKLLATANEEQQAS